MIIKMEHFNPPKRTASGFPSVKFKRFNENLLEQQVFELRKLERLELGDWCEVASITKVICSDKAVIEEHYDLYQIVTKDVFAGYTSFICSTQTHNSKAFSITFYPNLVKILFITEPPVFAYITEDKCIITPINTMKKNKLDTIPFMISPVNGVSSRF